MALSYVDIINILVGGSFGGDWTLFTLVGLAAIAVMAFKWRLPAPLALGMGWAVVYGFLIIQPVTSPSIQLILALLTVGLAVSIISNLLKYGRDSA